jgi:alkanesulfonate monooxygenase SsuD/methylene tetrahydromethanopterin reductase-like flavin-dependent oxidoreductase (luciferase family)
MAAAGDRALRACGEIADGLIVSNLTPSRSTERLRSVVGDAAARVNRKMPRIVQYIPCVVRPDGDAARQAVKAVLGEMLVSFWPIDDDWPPAKKRLVEESDIPRCDFTSALTGLRRGESASAVLDERFVAAFAIAGTAQECLHQAARYHRAGVDELALTFAGAQPLEDMAYLCSQRGP